MSWLRKRAHEIDLKHHIEENRVVKTGNGMPIPMREPTLLFRARDRLALPALRHYRGLCAQDGATDFQLECVDEMIERFEWFAKTFPKDMKQPGCTQGK